MRQSPQQSTTSTRPLTKPPVPPKPKLQERNKQGEAASSHVSRDTGKIYFLGSPSVLIPVQATTKERIIPIHQEKCGILPEISKSENKDKFIPKVSSFNHTDLVLAPINTNFNKEGQNVSHPPSGKDNVLALSKSSLLLEKLNGGTQKKLYEEHVFVPRSVPSSSVTVNQSVVSKDGNVNRKTNSTVSNNVNIISVNGVVTGSPSSTGPENHGLSTYVYGESPSLTPSFQSREPNPNVRPCLVPSMQSALPLDKRATYDGGDPTYQSVHLPNLSVKASSYTNVPSISAPTSPVTKPQLQKSEAFDNTYDKKLYRGISRATDNETLVSKARSELAQGILDAVDGKMDSNSPFFVDTPIFTFTLPDLTMYSDDFRTFLEKDLIESSTLVSLESAGRLNWWTSINASRGLWPLATTGDGNCLLHAASLGMWGFHDRLLTLRKSLHEFLTQSPYSMPLWRRWRWQLSMQNRETGLVYNATEWDDEWSNILRLASSTPRNGTSNLSSSTPNLSQATSLSQGKLNSDCTGEVYESLEEIHVLALAHILRRPVIVVADTTLKDVNGAPFAPIPFGGIYLPLECPPKECQRSPLILAYDAAHFSALVVMETSEGSDQALLPAVIPVTDCHHELLPIQFVVDPGEDFAWGRDEYDPMYIQKLTITANDKKGLLTEYLSVKQVPIPPSYLEAATNSFRPEETEPLSNFITTHPNLEKKSSDSSFDSDEGPTLSDPGPQPPRSKASKQMLTVVKQFGSIGRSMSKKIKKNFNNLSNFSRTGSFKRKNGNFGKVQVSTKQNFILAAEIYTNKRYAYQEEMITNYLNNARIRFQKHQTAEKTVRAESADSAICQCISPGCTLYGTSHTAYMCSGCYNKQKEQEEKEYPVSEETTYDVDSSRIGYGTGRSKFYANLDDVAMKNAALIPVTTALTGFRDRTLFLSNSTFYNDTIPSYNLTKRSDSREQKPLKAMPSKVNSRPGDGARLSKTNTKESLSPVSIDQINHLGSLPCRSFGCTFYGSSQMDGYCSKCHGKSSGKEKTLNVEQAKSTRL